MHGTVALPFDASEPAHISLHEPPLAVVLVQVRFSSVMAVASEQLGAAFHDALRERYPEGRPEQEILFNVGGAGAPTGQTSTLWRLLDEEQGYRVTLGASFITIETSQYDGHEAFFQRVGEALEVCSNLVRPRRAERVGVRYVHRLAEAEPLGDLIRPELLGVLANPSTAPASVSITQALWPLPDDATLAGRWGRLPAGAALDPTLLAADEPSWMLDVDVYGERHREFEPEALAELAFAYSRHAYRFFRWSVEPAFLRRFGADEETLRSALTNEGLV
jgi:uncharacterized protein (TIGR04255 family)